MNANAPRRRSCWLWKWRWRVKSRVGGALRSLTVPGILASSTARVSVTPPVTTTADNNVDITTFETSVWWREKSQGLAYSDICTFLCFYCHIYMDFLSDTYRGDKSAGGWEKVVYPIRLKNFVLWFFFSLCVLVHVLMPIINVFYKYCY